MTKRPSQARDALLLATEELLVQQGYPAVTTRRVAAQAGLNQALVHYHFGTIPDLLLAVHDRISARLQEAMFESWSGDEPLLAKWKRASDAWFSTDFSVAYLKIHLELLALSANRPELRQRVNSRLAFFRELLIEAISAEATRLRVEIDTQRVEALAAMAQTIFEGACAERVVGYERGQRAMFDLLTDNIAGLFPSSGIGPRSAVSDN